MTSRRPLALHGRGGRGSARAGGVALLAAALLLVGCGEEIPEALTEQAVGVDAEVGGRDAPTPEEAQADDEFSPDDERYPEGLPEELPLPGGMELLESSVEDADGGTVVSLEAAVDDTFDETALFFDTELPAADWAIVDNVEADEDADPTERWQVEGFGWTGSVELRQQGDANDIGGTTTRLLVDLRSSG